MPSITESSVLEAKRRAKNYWNVDGLPTLFIGLLFLSPLLIAEIPRWLGERLLGLLCFIALWEFHDHAIVEWIKERLTYPRTGYVPREEQESPSPFMQLSLDKESTHEETGLQRAIRVSFRALVIAALVAIPVLFWSIADGGKWIVWVEALFFVFVGAARLKESGKNKLAYIDVFGFVLAGIAIAALPHVRGAFLFLAPGIVFTLRGGITLLLYLRRNPVAQS